jgi:hypothetical protein
MISVRMNRFRQRSRFTAPDRKRRGENVMNPPQMRKLRIAAFAWALLLGLAAQGAPALHAAEPWPSARPLSPTALARQFRSLTEGGLFNPLQANSIDQCCAVRYERASDASPPATSLDHDLW